MDRLIILKILQMQKENLIEKWVVEIKEVHQQI